MKSEQLISKDALIDALEKAGLPISMKALEIIARFPTADAEHVLRCAECAEADGAGGKLYCYKWGGKLTKPTGYCWAGWKKK